ncbi:MULTISPECIES: M3 family metallopeptidase [unclassified Shewanella]|uniref:M3 family metallopeptidase n=1 Tax=unclassified Shewanella TaxID=196818 RepID=UPI001BBDBAAA|nr:MULTISPECIES: M3 family metallopeptidase [unclassified Shewanella]GIU16141.1 Zn-dependent oligopeptidase [Shewanella sp. MBTL60-112-B1]GIU33780.1 Zn-dependent oligopeptidase [Shewanella sp. MBTL60-112-B2]
MQKYTSVPPAKQFTWLLSPLLFFVCWINTAAYAAVSPIPLLVEQCLSYRFPDKLFNDASDSDTLAVKLERDFLGFFNINDRIKYYRQFPLSYADRERLLQCQLFLADELALFFKSTQFQSIRFKLAESDNPAVQALSMRINRIAKSNESPKYKAQLHTAQAAFKQGVSSQSLSLNFTNDKCKLPQNIDATKANDFNDTLASYLIKQTDQQCRKQVWQAYQARASIKNKSSLDLIKGLRQQQANLDGFNDFVSEQLAEQWLSKPEAVAQFLRGQTQAISIAPWDLGLVLSKAKATSVEPVLAEQWIMQVATELQAFGITVTQINQKLYRAYLDRRLLGDIYITYANRVAVKPIRQQVVGQQFGQAELILKPELNSYQQQSAAINSIAKVITQFASGQPFYLYNTIGDTQDTAQIDTLWLQQYLKNQLLPELKSDSREAIVLQYAKQLQVFRAKVALNTYLASDSSLRFDLNRAFTQAFSAHWDNIKDAPYTFSAIVYEGPLYYQKIWQQALANYIYQSTKDCQNQKLVFDYLVVNESSNSIANILRLLLDEPLTHDSLIKRTQHAFNHQDQHPRRCTILRK